MSEAGVMELYVVEVVHRDENGQPDDCIVRAGPYRNTIGGNMEALDALRVLQLRHPQEEFAQMGYVTGLEVRS